MELSPLILIIWIEITFLTIGALLFLLIAGFTKRARDKKAVNAFFKALKKDRERRLAEIQNSLAGYGLGEEAIKKHLRDIDHQELNLYQHIGTMYAKRSDSLLKTINVAQEATTQSFLNLGLMLVDGDAVGEGGGASRSELEALQKENENLREELSVTMDTIGRMLSEYSSMFGSDENQGLDREKIMESFESADMDDEVIVSTDDEVPDDELLEIEDDTDDIPENTAVPDDELLEIADQAFSAADDEMDSPVDKDDDTSSDTQPLAEAESDSEVDAMPDAEVEPMTEAEAEAEFEAAESKSKSEAEPQVEAESKSHAESEAEEPSKDVEPDFEAQPKAEPQAKAKLDTSAAMSAADVDDLLNELNLDSEEVTAEDIDAALDDLELGDMVDIESDLEEAIKPVESSADEVDISDVEIEDVDEFDIDALLENHIQQKND